ncbi:MAG: serine hydrolase [Bacteroides sp.]|nr:serine hydrolase [Bacteroides sp.]
MKKLLTLCLWAGCLLGATAQPLPQVAPELAGMDSRRLRYADEAIEQAIQKGDIPGAVLGIVHQGKLAYVKAYGNKEVYPRTVPMEVNTIFDMASCTKSISTAISAMILIERGQLRLLDRVNLYIPGFQGWEGEDGRKKDIRIVDIMTHTSGLPSYAPVEEVAEKYGAPAPDGLIEYISTCPRQYEPQQGFVYSCLNYVTLQRVVETISGQPLHEFAKEHIFDVLGMESTTYFPTGELLERTAPTEKMKDGSVLRGLVHDPMARILNGGNSGNAGLFSDVQDLAILAAALLNEGEYNGKRILSPLGVKTMRTVPRGVATFGRTPGWDVFSAYASNNGDLLGPNTFGHTGYTGTSFIVDPDNDVAVIFLTNRVHPDDSGEIVRLRSLVANAVGAALCPPARTYTEHYYKRVEQFRLEEPIRPDEIVMLGNSLTEGGGNWSKRLGKKRIRNRGIAGDEALGIYDRLYQILPGKPQKLFLLVGANDVSHDLSTDSIVSLITQVVDKISSGSPETQLYLQSLLPINESFGRYKRLTGKTSQFPEINQRLEALAAQRSITFVNLYPLFTEPGTDILRKELTNDGLHLTEEGYRIWSKALKPYL